MNTSFDTQIDRINILTPVEIISIAIKLIIELVQLLLIYQMFINYLFEQLFIPIQYKSQLLLNENN